MKWKINKKIYMKKFAFLGLLFFILFSQVFADKNTNKFNNIYFSWSAMNEKERTIFNDTLKQQNE